jgi:glutamate synthase (NADPH) large chain
VVNYFTFVAQDVRAHLAQLGVRSLGELVGRTDLLEQLEGVTPVQHKLDLTPLIDGAGLSARSDFACALPRNPMRDDAELASRIAADTATAVVNKSGGTFSYLIANTDRAIGARLSGDVARRHGDHGMDASPIELKLEGAAGQSLGAWNAGGVHIELVGEANDGVGKGMAGGRIVVRPPADAPYASQDAAIIGNTCLYGATDGELYAAGRAGERFAVRNSGAIAVIEGAGDHCCEYMTGGVVVVLGYTGRNFAAGMSGGIAYVLDEDGTFKSRCNMTMVELEPVLQEEEIAEKEFGHYADLESHGRVDVMSDLTAMDAERLRLLIANHARYTNSKRAAEILADWQRYRPLFRKVMPVEYRRALAEMAKEKAATMRAAE